MKVTNVWRAVFALLLVLVTWQTLTPDPDEVEPGFLIARLIAEFLFHNAQFADKVAHFAAYVALGGSAAFAHLKIGGHRSLTIAGLAAYGALLEYFQGLGGVRSPEIADALANSLGVLASYPAALALEGAVSGRSRA